MRNRRLDSSNTGMCKEVCSNVCSTSVRNLAFLICTSILFFVLPIIYIIVHFFKQSTFEAEICIEDEAGNETCEETQSFKLATYWIYIDLVSMLVFSFVYLVELIRRFTRQCKRETLAKKTTKPLGGYVFDDPSRFLKNRESIYNLAFMANLDNKKFEELDIDEDIRPTRF